LLYYFVFFHIFVLAKVDGSDNAHADGQVEEDCRKQ
jgi:hypothetical protein